MKKKRKKINEQYGLLTREEIEIIVNRAMGVFSIALASMILSKIIEKMAENAKKGEGEK